MGYLTDKIGVAIYNGAVKRRNKFVRGDYKVKSKATKFAKASGSYLNAVGTNIVEDVSTGQSQMFTFKMPKNHSFKTNQSKKKRKRQGNHGNPYPLI
jgi:hypothetical protein